jgi:predicted ATPase/DNA-binding winged helix-turn-helix (wHTH) protein
MDEEAFAFGSFRLIPAQRMLLDDGKPLRLGSRALDILITLVERAGETITKEQLVSRTWPDTVVDEGALRVHVAALRKALGDDRARTRYIANVPGRGYSFVAPVAREQRRPAGASLDETPTGNNLPAQLSRIVGRDDAITTLTTELARRRLLTIVGPGGIGKTTVAIAVAETLSASYRDGVWFVGLASLADPELVPSALSTALGISVSGANKEAALTGWFRDKRALIVLDSCEHVVSAAASIAGAVLKAAPRICILATSREPLRAEGEWLHRLASLEIPLSSSNLTAKEALHYSAVQLFDDRARAAVDEFVFDDATAPAVLEICRRLDGVPLALELAAARVDAFGVKGLAARLDDRFAVLTKGRRTALPRHQTLRAAIDWSYDALPEIEQTVFRRLAVFRGAFTMNGAAVVASDEKITTVDVLERVANLAAKSLVATEISGEITYHRLLDTTRAYALDKLTDSAEIQSVTLRHAQYYRDFLTAAAKEDKANAADRRADYAHEVDNIRAALGWAFGPRGSASIAVVLAAASIPVWIEMSLLSECSDWMEKAVANLGVTDRGSRHEMQVQAALGFSLMFTRGMTDEAQAALQKAVELAESRDDPDYQLRTLFGLCVFRLRLPDFRGALELASRCEVVADRVTDLSARPTADWMLGLSLFCLGDLTRGRMHMERVRDRYRPVSRRTEVVRFGFDQRIYALGILGLARWIEGFPEQALQQSRTSIDEAQKLQHPVSLCIAMWTGCLVALWVGDLVALERLTTGLLDHTEKHSLDNYHAYGLGFDGELHALKGDAIAGVRLIQHCLDGLRKARHRVFYSVFLGALAKRLSAGGDIAHGLALVDEALGLAERNDESWYMAELLRIKGELLLSRSAPVVTEAEGFFLRSLAWARRQGALSWELRAAMNLAQLWGHDARNKAQELIAPIYGQFTEGFATADLKHAKGLLEQFA